MDPNNLDMIMQEISHNHDDIKQLGGILMVGLWIIWISVLLKSGNK
jgi:hypothetical protein